jgi:hypothetical protein
MLKADMIQQQQDNSQVQHHDAVKPNFQLVAQHAAYEGCTDQAV